MQARSDPPTFCSQTGLANETRTLEVIPLGGGLCVDFFIIDLSSESEPSNTSRPSPFPTSKTLDPNVEQTQSRTDWQAQVIGGAVGGTIAAILIGVIAGWMRKRRTRVVVLESTSHLIHSFAFPFRSLMILCRRKSCGYNFSRARTARFITSERVFAARVLPRAWWIEHKGPRARNIVCRLRVPSYPFACALSYGGHRELL